MVTDKIASTRFQVHSGKSLPIETHRQVTTSFERSVSNISGGGGS